MSEVTASLAATRRIDGERTAESKVSRAGELVAVEFINVRGDTLVASMDGDGRIRVQVDRDGKVAGLIELAAPQAVHAKPPLRPMGATLSIDDEVGDTGRDSTGMLVRP